MPQPLATPLNSEWLNQTPQIVTEWGEDLFLKLPLYESNKIFTPIYLNIDLISQFFGIKNDSWTETSTLISQVFSVTIAITRSTGKQVGWAYVDKQGEDAYGCALVGNGGSGRAYYTGNEFNIKGEKTPLATSAITRYSDGILKTETAIWSTLIGNTFHQELAVHSAPILAILRINDTQCRIVRIDEKRALNKITHLFYKPHALSREQLIETAEAFGRLEGEKFIHRILHGAWSAGNISLEGHLIDYDSICAVKGRQPQYCFTPYYPDNYFGFEYEGQLLILKDMLNRPAINAESVSYDYLKSKLLEKFKKEIRTGFVYLMGFPHYQEISEQWDAELRVVVDLFYALAPYTYYQNQQSLFTNFTSVLFFHLFDFSAFFRVYGLLKLMGVFTVPIGLTILMDSPRQSAMIEKGQQHADQDIIQKVRSHFSNYLISPDDAELSSLKQQALLFIEAYEHLFNLIVQKKKDDLQSIASRAYVINEDRFYLFPMLSVEKLLTDWQRQKPPEIINRFITRLITASKRDGSTDALVADQRLFLEGYVYVKLHPIGFYQVIIFLDNDRIDFSVTNDDCWKIEVHHQMIEAYCEKIYGGIEIKTTPLQLTQLITRFSRDSVFLLSHYFLYQNGKKIKLTDLYFQNNEPEYYL